jgi:hypothetical protein
MIAIAADERLNATARIRAQEQPGLRSVIMVATAALVMRQPMVWKRAVATAMMPLQPCLCTVSGEAGQRFRRCSRWNARCGTTPKQNFPVMDRRRACLPIPAGLPHQLQIPRGQSLPGPPPRIPSLARSLAQVGPQVPPAPFASLRANGAPPRGRAPAVGCHVRFQGLRTPNPSRLFLFRLPTLMQACAVEGGH